MSYYDNDHELKMEVALRLYTSVIKSLGTPEGLKETAKNCWAAGEAFVEGIDEAILEADRKKRSTWLDK
jgi:hypothetical protein